jgi:hypothetical protein
MQVINKCLNCNLITINNHAGATTECCYCHSIYVIWLNYDQYTNEYYKEHKDGVAFGGPIHKKLI